MLFRSIAETGDLLSKHAPGILQIDLKQSSKHILKVLFVTYDLVDWVEPLCLQ